MWSIVLVVKVMSWHPTPGEDPNWYLTPCFLNILKNCLQIKLPNTLDPISIRLNPLHLLGSYRSTILGIGKTWPSCHSLKSTLYSQNSVSKSKWWHKFYYDIDLKAFGGTPLILGALSLVNSWMARMNSVHEGVTSSSPITSRKCMSFITILSVGLWLLSTFLKWLANTLIFSSSFSARLP